jgi:transcriptional regulator with XRE-family HTH domain
MKTRTLSMTTLRFWRLAGGLSLRDLSRATGVALTTISELDLGYSQGTLRNLNKLATYFDCQPGDLLKEVILTCP